MGAQAEEETAEVADLDRWVVVKELDGELSVVTYEGPELLALATDGFSAAGSGEIVSIERDSRVERYADAFRSLQWHLDELPFETLHPTLDGSGVTVAVVDTAIALGHEDLPAFRPGWDAIENQPLNPAQWVVADADHGTHVAGLLAAIPDNGVGGVGAAPGVELIPVRVLKSNGGFVSDVVEGVLWAITHDADIINLSLGTGLESAALEAAVDAAEEAGIVVVAAAGNNGEAGDPIRYPAAYDTVLAVGAIDADLAHWSRSSRAPYLDVVAPGVDMLSLGGDGVSEYRYMTGTSMATPQVSGLLALLLQADPDATPGQLREIIRSTARDLGPVGHDPEYGHGVIDPLAALAALDIQPPPPPPEAPSRLRAVESPIQTVLTWSPLEDEVVEVQIERDGEIVATLPPSSTEWIDTAPVSGSIQVYTVIAVGPGGLSWSSVSVVVPEAQLRAWVVTDRGRVLPFGSAVPSASADNGAETIAGTPSQSGQGHWLVDGAGRVTALGDAVHHGDLAALDLNEPIVGMAVTPTGGGYWLVAADGGIFAFGDALYLGSMGAVALNQPIVDLAVTPSGRGYLLAAADGGIFAFGDAVFRGSTGAITLNEPMVSLAVSPDGYWMVARDGGVFTFGVEYLGSIPGLVLDHSTLAAGRRIRAINGGTGYLVLTSDGTIFGFGTAEVLAQSAPALAPGERAVDLLMLQL